VYHNTPMETQEERIYSSYSFTTSALDEVSGRHTPAAVCPRQKDPRYQGRIKGFVGPRHFSSISPFGDSASTVEATVCSRLSGLIEAEGMHG
jgi:hypothetical protein